MLSRRVGACLLIVAVSLVVFPRAAQAAGGDCGRDPNPTCITFGGTGGASGAGRGSSGGSGGCTWQGISVACTDPDFGSYMGGGCYWRAIEPAPDFPPPAGKDPSTGAWGVQSCYLHPGGSAVDQVNFWLDDPGATVTPAQLAAQALAKIHLLGSEIGVAPDPSGAGAVGLPVWLWTAVTPGTWGPLSASASAGGITVTITARARGSCGTWATGIRSRVTTPEPRTGRPTGTSARQPAAMCTPRRAALSRILAAGTRSPPPRTGRSTGPAAARPVCSTRPAESQTSVEIGEIQVVTPMTTTADRDRNDRAQPLAAPAPVGVVAGAAAAAPVGPDRLGRHAGRGRRGRGVPAGSHRRRDPPIPGGDPQRAVRRGDHRRAT